MWLGFAVGSAFFAGITSVLAKCGIKKTDSYVATAIRTVVVVFFSWFMVLLTGVGGGITSISLKSFIFLILSGLATGASWLCYFKALQMGDINKVVPIDKSSTVLSIVLAFLILGEEISGWKLIGIFAIAIGTILMIQKSSSGNFKEKREGGNWLIFAVLSAVFASLTSILGKIGITGVDSNLGTAIRTIVVLIMAWILVFVTGKKHTVKMIDRKELFFILLSGFATGGSWLCYYRALQTGPASIIVPIDKLSILVSIVFSYLVFKERLSVKALTGLVLIVAGTLVMLL